MADQRGGFRNMVNASIRMLPKGLKRLVAVTSQMFSEAERTMPTKSDRRWSLDKDGPPGRLSRAEKISPGQLVEQPTTGISGTDFASVATANLIPPISSRRERPPLGHANPLGFHPIKPTVSASGPPALPPNRAVPHEVKTKPTGKTGAEVSFVVQRRLAIEDTLATLNGDPGLGAHHLPSWTASATGQNKINRLGIPDLQSKANNLEGLRPATASPSARSVRSSLATIKSLRDGSISSGGRGSSESGYSTPMTVDTESIVSRRNSLGEDSAIDAGKTADLVTLPALIYAGEGEPAVTPSLKRAALQTRTGDHSRGPESR